MIPHIYPHYKFKDNFFKISMAKMLFLNSPSRRMKKFIKAEKHYLDPKFLKPHTKKRQFYSHAYVNTKNT